ncbi:3-dehydroquinate synthase [bacterium HR40]|nr:3-dehydroquinate synthase [bacterium HR40]
MSEEQETLEVSLGARSYPIHIGHGLLERAGELLRPQFAGRRLFVVTDEHVVAAGHADRLEHGLAAADFTFARIVLPPGEATKSFIWLERLLDELLLAGAERRSVVVALGGGVIGDLAGFAAAILLRGVAYVQLPTTLLAQVDSAIGGKTGIDTRHGKNLVGAFHQPRMVLVDTATLATLPMRERRAGYAEIVKYGCIVDADFLAWLEGQGRAVVEGEPAPCRRAIRRALEIKAEVVAEDEFETSGRRALLNFGHTFAHAFEACAGYGEGLLHGEAVAMGMVCATELSAALGYAPSAQTERLVRHLRQAGLPVRPRDLGLRFEVDALLAAMRHDKKVVDGRLRFVLWRGPGQAFIASDVPEDLVRRLLTDALA